MRILLPVKAVGTMAFIALFFWCYFAVQRNPAGAAVTMPLTPIDHWIRFSPAAFPAYASLWVYVSLPPAFLTRPTSLLRFGLWIAGLCLFCLGIFWLFPTTVPAFEADLIQHPEIALLQAVDAKGNACPSLHVATAVFSAVWLQRLLRVTAAPALLRWLNILLCVAIVWSTLATRQHVFLDVLAGLAVGAAFAALSLRRAGASAGADEL
jgi:membrane-associated phospholipid phosphatase